MAIQFPHQLNLDQDLRLTNSVWDDNIAQWMTKTQTYIQTSLGIWTPLTLDANDRLQTSVKDSALPVGAATETSLAALLAKIIAAPSTEAKQDTVIGNISDVKTLLTALNGYVDGLEGYTDSLESILSSILTQLGTTGLKKIIDALPPGDNNIGNVDILTTVLPVGSDTVHELNLTLTGAAQNLSAQACKSVTIQAEPTNLGYVYIGKAGTVSATVHSYILSPGGSITIQCANTNLYYVIGTAGDKICGGGEV